MGDNTAADILGFALDRERSVDGSNVRRDFELFKKFMDMVKPEVVSKPVVSTQDKDKQDVACVLKHSGSECFVWETVWEDLKVQKNNDEYFSFVDFDVNGIAGCEILNAACNIVYDNEAIVDRGGKFCYHIYSQWELCYKKTWASGDIYTIFGNNPFNVFNISYATIFVPPAPINLRMYMEWLGKGRAVSIEQCVTGKIKIAFICRRYC